MCQVLLGTLHPILQLMKYHQSYFRDEKIQAPDEITCPRPNSSQGLEPGLDLG